MYIFNYNDKTIILIILPIIYTQLFIGVAKIHKYITFPGMFVLNVVTFIRYVILPFLILINDSYMDEYGYFQEGAILMIYESICLGILLIFITRKYYKNTSLNKYKINKDNKNYLLKIITIIAIILIILQPSILEQYNFVFTSASSAELTDSSTIATGLPFLIVDWGKLLFPLILTIPLITRYKKTNNNIYYLLVIAIILFFNVLIFSGTSRSSMLMPALASLFYLLIAFPNKKKQIFVFMSTLIIIAVFYLTFLKNEYTGTTATSSFNDLIDYVDSYFVGPENLGIAIGANQMYSGAFNFQTFLTDILGNFPGLSDFFDLENRTNTFFNLFAYSGGPQRDQIIPSIGQGLFYFGYVFSFIPQFIIVFLMAKFDNLYSNSNNIIGIYIFSYIAVKFGFTYAQSLSSSLGFLYATAIPLILIYIVNKFINKKFTFRRKNSEQKNQTFIHYK